MSRLQTLLRTREAIPRALLRQGLQRGRASLRLRPRRLRRHLRVLRPPRTQGLRLGGAARPNFTGNWKLVKIDGDMDAFMKELGLGWMIRKAASTMNYGVGKSFNNIEHTGDTIKVENINPGGGEHVQKFRIDGTEQDDVLPREKTAVKLVATWEEVGGAPALAVRVRRVDDPSKGMPRSKRYLNGASMVVELTSPSGIVTHRTFEKS